MTGVVTHCIPAGAPWDPAQIPVPGLNTVTTTVVLPTGTPRGRIIYLPSTAGFSSQITDDLNANDDRLTFTNAAVADGWQVISVDEIGLYAGVCTPAGDPDRLASDVSTDAGHGARFLATQLHYWDHAKLWAEANHGGVLPTVVAGFSWGAWAAIQVAANRTSDLVGYIARSAPTQWAAAGVVFLCPNYGGVNFAGMNLSLTCLNGVPIPGLLSWGGSDTVITISDLATIVSNAQAAGQPVSSDVEAGEGHQWGTTDSTNIYNWLKATIG